VWSDRISLRRITDLLLRYNPIDFCHGKTTEKTKHKNVFKIRLRCIAICNIVYNGKFSTFSFKMHHYLKAISSKYTTG
jgi:hypothetical protein